MEKRTFTRESLAAIIDQTLLKSVATEEDIVKLCAGARRYNFASVCVNSGFVPLVARQLAGSRVKVCSVVGFPLGAMATAAKAFEAAEAVRAGAEEIDMVINVGLLKGGRLDQVREDIGAVVAAARGSALGSKDREGRGIPTDKASVSYINGKLPSRLAKGSPVTPNGAVPVVGSEQEGILVKVIIETCYLTEEEKVTACRLAEEVGADFVKTSTGFGSGGATVADVRLMRQVVGDRLGVKASGGIRTLQDALAMVEAGASRLGASAGEAIVEGLA